MAGRPPIINEHSLPRTMLSQISAVIGLDPYRATFDELLRAVGSSGSDRSHTLLAIDEVIAASSDHSTEVLRVGATKALLALLPESAERVEELLKSTGSRNFYEWHFSIFCYLDEVPRMERARSFAARIPSLVEQYLLNVRVESAHAAWMAGDLMGDHWDAEDAVPVLIRSAKNARYVAGRKGAIHGLGCLLARLSSSNASGVVAALASVARSDRSLRVQQEAAVVLDRHHLQGRQ